MMHHDFSDRVGDSGVHVSCYTNTTSVSITLPTFSKGVKGESYQNFNVIIRQSQPVLFGVERLKKVCVGR